jgi:hypothetical protein
MSAARGDNLDNLIEPPVRSGEFLLDLVPEYPLDRHAEAGPGENKDMVEIVIPLREDLAVRGARRRKILPRDPGADSTVSNRPVQAPHPGQPPAKEHADLLASLHCLAALLVMALHLMLDLLALDPAADPPPVGQIP